MSLPETYQEVEYIESTGTQRIETNFNGNIYVEGVANYTRSSSGVSILFGQSSGGARWFGMDNQGKLVDGNNTFSANPFTKFSFSMSWNFNSLRCLNIQTVNEETLTGDFSSGYPLNNLTLFAAKNTSINQWVGASFAKIYEFKIYQDSTKSEIIADFIPCYRKSDSEIGLYDLVNDTFYANAGTGTFIKGPVVLNTIAEKLEYINDTKQLIKQSLIYKGEDINSSDTFRSYMNKINNLHTTAIDWTDIGYYNDEPLDIIDDGYDYAVEIQQNWSNIANLSEKFSEDRDMKYMPLVDTSNATNMSKFMYNCYRLETLPELDTSNVTNMSYVLYNCRALKTIPNWNFSNVTNMSYAFYYCKSLKTIPSNLDTSKVTNFSYAFKGCEKLVKEDIEKLDTSKCTNFEQFVNGCNALTGIPNVDYSKGTNFNTCFSSLNGLTEARINSLPEATNLYQCFASNPNLVTVSLPSLPKATNLQILFGNCNNLQTVEALDTSAATNVGQLFYYCWSLKNIPVMDFGKVTTFGGNLFFAVNVNLTDESWNNLLASFTSAVSYTGTKTLKALGISQTNANKCTTLSNYADFVAAGWTTGY